MHGINNIKFFIYAFASALRKLVAEKYPHFIIYSKKDSLQIVLLLLHNGLFYFFFLLRLHSPSGSGLHIFEVSNSHSDTHTPCDSWGRVICPSQRQPDNPQLTREDIHAPVEVFQVLFLPVFPTKTWKEFLIFTMRATCPSHFILSDVITKKESGEEYMSWSCSVCSFVPVPFYFLLLRLKLIQLFIRWKARVTVFRL